MKTSVPARLRIYIGLLLAIVIAVLATTVVRGKDFDDQPLGWLTFTLLLAGIEYVSIYFYDQKARYSLSASEAIILPMLVGLTFPQVVWSLTIANALARSPRWRAAPVKELFNVVQYGCAGIVSASIWAALSHPSSGFTVRNAAIASLAVVSFAVLSHLFVAGAISLAGEGRFRDLSFAIASTFFINLGGALTVGLLLAAAYSAANWMVGLFVLPLIALFLGNRAVLRQQRETQRVEHLHEAARALAAGPDLEGALHGFLRAVREISSTADARAVINVAGRWLWSGARDGEEIARLRPTEEASTKELLDLVRRSGGTVILSEDDPASKEAAASLDLRNGIVVPLETEDAVVGFLLAADRVGADKLGEADARLLEALAEELMISLDSYRLFAQVVEERERFGRIFNGSTEGICLIDSESIVRAWNPALEKISGYAASEVVGRPWSEVVMVRDRDQRRIEGMELVGLATDDEVELVTRDGPTRWVSMLSGPTQTSEDPGWVVLVRDVSSEHDLEQAKTDFLSTISHELRTPLTTIKGSLQVLERGPERIPADLASQMIGVTTRGAERLERLVMNLLVVSQIENGVMPVFVEEIAFDDIILERVGIILRDHPRLQVIPKHESLTVRGDRERLGQAIEHVLDNALKFGGPEGLITVELERKNGYAQVSVTDEGPGIAAADEERIWERFVRLGDVLTRETQGAGVGLFIAKRSIEALEGQIWVDSAPGKGSTFRLTVPLARPMVVEEQAEPA